MERVRMLAIWREREWWREEEEESNLIVCVNLILKDTNLIVCYKKWRTENARN